MVESDAQETRPVNKVPDEDEYKVLEESEYKATIGGSLTELEHEVDGLIDDMSEVVFDQGDENKEPSGSPTRIRLELLVHKIKKLRTDLDT